MTDKKILIVDDDVELLALFAEAFTDKGYKVSTATTADDAMAVIAKEDIKVLFLDLNLPGMSGIELCRKIKAENASSVIHAITGYTSVFQFTDCREAGFDDYLVKPVHLGTLFSAAGAAFDKIARWRNLES